MDYSKKLVELSAILNKLTFECDSERLSVSLLDIGESSVKITDLLSKLILEIDKENIEDILNDIGEELRHIIYHIKDSKYYSYLLPFDDEVI